MTIFALKIAILGVEVEFTRFLLAGFVANAMLVVGKWFVQIAQFDAYTISLYVNDKFVASSDTNLIFYYNCFNPMHSSIPC